MKVLSFSYCFPNSQNPSWGVFVEQRLQALANRVELQVVSPIPTFPVLAPGYAGPGRELWRGLTVHRPKFLYLPGIFKSTDAWFYDRGLRSWLTGFSRDWKPDLLDAHFIWPDGVGVSRLARRLNLPYSITLRGKIYPCLEVPSQRKQCADALQHAAAVISLSGPMAEEARKLGAPPERVHVITNGVNLEMFQPRDKLLARRKLRLGEEGRIVVSMAHLGPRKGHREVIQALAQLPKDVRLVIVGGDAEGGKNRSELLQMIQTLNLKDRVLLAGQQAYENIPYYFNAADVSVLASYREGCPNAVLESLASGTPVVATRVGAVPDLLTSGDYGRMVPVRDVRALQETLNEVLNLSWSSETVSHAPAVKSWDQAAGEVLEIFKKIPGLR